VHLETGRTHQVRVHFSASGHPVIGDSVYRRREGDVPVTVRRQMLHAHVLGFDHPGSGKPVKATSPLPADFEEALRVLRRAKAKPALAPKKNAPIARGVRSVKERKT
jgi:23S rRNA pseudouridine1911/1915/1917 synthase